MVKPGKLSDLSSALARPSSTTLFRSGMPDQLLHCWILIFVCHSLAVCCTDPLRPFLRLFPHFLPALRQLFVYFFGRLCCRCLLYSSRRVVASKLCDTTICVRSLLVSQLWPLYCRRSRALAAEGRENVGHQCGGTGSIFNEDS